MAIRKILVPVAGTLETTNTLDLAVDLARALGSHVEALYMQVDPGHVLATGYQEKTIAWIEANRENLAGLVDLTRDAALAAFHAWALRGQLPISTVPAAHSAGVTAGWRECIGSPERTIPDLARFCDLVVLGRPESSDPERYPRQIYAALCDARRPVVLAPLNARKLKWSCSIVAWNASPEAQQALTAALPLLSRMSRVILLSIGEVAWAGPPRYAELLDYLAYHDVPAERLTLEPDRRSVAVRLLDEAKAHDADMLIMGAYTHSRLRDALFGGTTLQIVETADLPVLLAH